MEADRACPDEDCGGQAEPEEEDGLKFWKCWTCGFEFGYQRLQTGDDSCSLGVPEDVRRHAQPQPKGVFIGSIGRRPQ